VDSFLLSVSISEEFGLEAGAFSPGLLVAALKNLGFDLVLDTNTAADLTICEEGTELLRRLEARKGKPDVSFGGDSPDPEPLPLFTSCCPGWMNFIEKGAPELAPYISTCKSPHMMYGALIKKFSEEWLGQPADKVYFTSIMPCVRKRNESDRPAFAHDGVRDVDNVITTKDLGQLLRMKGINPLSATKKVFHSWLNLLLDLQYSIGFVLDCILQDGSSAPLSVCTSDWITATEDRA
jgi:NADP-reducing hydrogenase subunit HndD